jgi:hypothetical protein
MPVYSTLNILCGEDLLLSVTFFSKEKCVYNLLHLNNELQTEHTDLPDRKVCFEYGVFCAHKASLRQRVQCLFNERSFFLLTAR